MLYQYNKIKKVFVSAILVVSMVMLTGCGKQSSYEIKTSMQQNNLESNLAEEDGKVKLTVWCWDPVFNISAVETAAEMYGTSHSNVEVQVVEINATDIIQQMSTTIKSGNYEDLPDILLMKDSNLSENLNYYDDVFADLSNSGIQYSDFAKYKVDMGVYQGKNYTVPFDSGAAIMCLREDIIEKAGYHISDFTDITWSQFIEMGTQVKAKTGYPLLSCQSGSSDFLMMLVQSGGEWLSKDQKPYIYDNAVLREAMVTYKQLVDLGILEEKNNWNAYTESITNAEVAGAMNGCWITATIMGGADQSGKWKMTNVPRLDNIETAVNYSNCGGSSWLIVNTSKNKDTAVDFMKSTFGSSVDFYSKILPVSGALATFLPANQSEAYQAPQEFFGGDPIYAKISEYTEHVPTIETDIHNATVYDKAGLYLIDYVHGKDMDSVLADFQQEADALY